MCVTVNKTGERSGKKIVKQTKASAFTLSFPAAMWKKMILLFFTFAIFFSIRTKRKKNAQNWNLYVLVAWWAATMVCGIAIVNANASKNRKVCVWVKLQECNTKKSGNQIVWIDNDGLKWAIHLGSHMLPQKMHRNAYEIWI